MTSLLQTRRVFVAILALGLFAMAARGITDPDVWWHLRTGQLILQNHSLFHTDPYSFTRFGQPWINHEWLSEILLFGLYRVAGFGGLIVAFAVVIAATFLMVFARSAGRPYLASLMTLWGAVASAPSWGVRPQMFSLLLASIFLVLLEASERPPQTAVVDRSADAVVGQPACGISHRTGFHRAIPDWAKLWKRRLVRSLGRNLRRVLSSWRWPSGFVWRWSRLIRMACRFTGTR